ncbi:MAG: hypothetical protein J3Q66DRAFT_6101 [Benniella sp.]|nr:MAG: hypothetical protein J3Q66DRAFT_6101 [Benniella sp.]
MPKRPLDQEDAAEDCYQGEHQGYDRNVRSKKRGSMDDDDVASMLLATELFGDSPSKSQWSSVHFLVKMRLAPSLTLQSFLAHMQEQHPEVAKPALASIWRRFKDFFVADNLEHAVLKDLVDISGMVSAFGAASYIEVEPVTTHPCDPIAQPSPSAPLPAPLVDNARSLLSPSSSSSSSAAAPAAPHPVGTITQPSPSSSSSSSAPAPAPAAPHPVGTITQPPSSVPSQLLQSPLATTSRSSRPSRSSKAARTSGDSSNNGNDSLGSVALAKMKYQFDMNFSAYQGLPWRLPSGSVVDDVVARLARQDGYESGLQSCVLEDPSKIIALFPAQGDKDELRRVLVERPEEALATLTDHEQAFVDSFGKSPEDVELMLGQGWANLPGGAELDVDFKMLVHHCFQQLYLTYRHFNFSLPKELKEAYYTDKVWGFMNVALDDVATLDHEPGEINSKTSGLRKNKDRTRPGRQVQGRKADGLVSTKGASHELCIVEAARKDQGPNGTKALDDTLKLIKGMKDMMDHIRASASENIRDQLVTYGIRISATTMTMYTMRQRPGRWYQMISHPPISLPTTWNEITGKRVSNVVSKLLGFKKDIMAMSVMVDQWTNEAVEDNGDRWVRTLTTPTSSPLLAPVSLPLQDIHTSPDEAI